MSPTATQAQEPHQPAAAEASHKRKRKREEAADHANKKVVERKYGIDLDILDCPICMEPFSKPVYQCTNGHTACSACCKKLISKKCPSCTLPTGMIRCLAIEKLVESLSVGCKYARHGCEEMEWPSGIENHEADCKYEPFCCPVPECDYEATRTPLLSHLTERHQIKTVATYNINTGVTFIIGPSDHIVMVDVDVKETHVNYLVHREVHENFGDIFFCTRFGDFDIVKYNLTIWHRSDDDSVPYSMGSARAIDLGCMKEYLKDFLLVPAKDCGPRQSFDVNFKVIEGYDDDDDDHDH